jgi:capsular exopolysaccharide synthesis family protein
VTEKTIILPPQSATVGPDSAYRLTMMVPKRRYFSYLRERWWVVLISIVVLVSTIIAYETVRTPHFVSFAQIYLANSVHLDTSDFISDANETYFGTQIELLKSGQILGAAMQKAGIQVPIGEKNPYNLDVAQPLKTSILVLQVSGPDPDITQRYLQYIIDGYLAYKKETHTSTSQDVLDSLRDELASKDADLQAEEDRLAEFERSNNVAVLEEETKGAGEYLAELNVQLAQNRLQAKLLSDQIDAETPAPDPVSPTNLLASASTNGVSTNSASTNALAISAADLSSQTALPEAMPPTTNNVEALTDTELESSRVQLAELFASKEENLRHMGHHNFEEEVARLKETIKVLSDQDRTEKVAQLKDLQKRIAAIQAAIPALEAQILQNNVDLNRSLSLKEIVQRDQGYYDHLLGTLQGVDMNKNLPQENLSVLQPATPSQPEKRYVPIRVAVAFVFGLFIGLALVYGWYLLDDRFVSFHDITDQFGETLLGLVPQIKVSHKQPAQALLAEVDDRQSYLESFRHLRSALLLSANSEAHPQILLFTSSTSGEGKTTVSANLARLLARSGLRVVLVDADEQGGGLQRLMGERGQPGVLDYLRGDASASAVVYPTGCEGLSFVPAGTRNAKSEGLFLRPKLGELLAELRRNHDFIIIDGPPVLTCDDASMLVPRADTVILVARPFYTRSRSVRQALDMLYQRQAKNVNIVLNRARKDDLSGHQAMRGFTTRAVALKS